MTHFDINTLAAANHDAAKRIDAAIVALAGTGRPFTAEDVRARVGRARIGESRKLLPALMSAASNRGLIKHIGWAESKRPSARSSAIRLWEGVQSAA